MACAITGGAWLRNELTNRRPIAVSDERTFNYRRLPRELIERRSLVRMQITTRLFPPGSLSNLHVYHPPPPPAHRSFHTRWQSARPLLTYLPTQLTNRTPYRPNHTITIHLHQLPAWWSIWPAMEARRALSFDELPFRFYRIDYAGAHTRVTDDNTIEAPEIKPATGLLAQLKAALTLHPTHPPSHPPPTPPTTQRPRATPTTPCICVFSDKDYARTWALRLKQYRHDPICMLEIDPTYLRDAYICSAGPTGDCEFLCYLQRIPPAAVTLVENSRAEMECARRRSAEGMPSPASF